MINKQIKNLCININKSILDALNKFDKNRNNFLIVVNSKNQFKGIITISDIRRTIIKGNSIESSIKKFINPNPVFYKDNGKKKMLQEFLLKAKIKNIEPKIIPVVNSKNIPINIIENFDFNNQVPIKKKLKKILIIGGAGYIGSILTDLLLQKGYEVSVLDKFIYQSKKRFLNEIKSKKNLKIFDGDTRHLNVVFNAVKNNDIVVHLGEMVGDPLCAKDPDLTFETNYLASVSIATICKILEISKFIYISSCSVYGESISDSYLNEKSNINPVSSYAKLKIMCEEAISRNIGSFCKPTIIRLGTVFGDSIRKRYDLVINLFSGLAANKKTIKIFGGTQWRPFIHVKDVCNFIDKIIESSNKKVNGQIFNLTKENVTIKEVGEIIKKKYGTNVVVDKNTNDTRNYKVSSLKAKKVLNFMPKFSIRYGINEMIKITKKNKIKNILHHRYINLKNYEKFK
jgi:nucleoside-diphosphate-sugar epimerase